MFPPDQATPKEYAPLSDFSQPGASMRIAWLHPNLGIGASSDSSTQYELISEPTGGAERLVVDAAVALQKRGHEVELFTSFHEDGPNGRSFEETRNGEFICYCSDATLRHTGVTARHLQTNELTPLPQEH